MSEIISPADIADLRYNPFDSSYAPRHYGDGGIPKERRTVPTSSPYWIKLFERPLKETPSSIVVNIVDGATLTEVEKTVAPASGQYRVNYDQPAPGIIEFNAAQAGEEVDIEYKGLGTLLQKSTMQAILPLVEEITAAAEKTPVYSSTLYVIKSLAGAANIKINNGIAEGQVVTLLNISSYTATIQNAASSTITTVLAGYSLHLAWKDSAWKVVYSVYDGSIVESKIGTGAVTNAKIGSSAVTNAKIGSSAVSTAKLKTSTGSQTFTAGSGIAQITLNAYSFFPSINRENEEGDLGTYVASSGSADSPRFSAGSYSASPSRRIRVYWRYVTSSGDIYWLFALRNKETGEVESMWRSADHPVFNTGLTHDEMPHPFGDVDLSKYEIEVINPELSLMKEIHKQAKAERTDELEIIQRDYEIAEIKTPQFSEKDGKAGYITRPAAVGTTDTSWPFYDEEEDGPAVVKYEVLTRPEYIKIKKIVKKSEK